MDRTTWLEARRKGIGGTDAAAILGLSPWRSAIDVWEDKLGIAPERPQTGAMRWGLALEDAIASAYTEETGRRVRRVGMRRARHVKDFPMLGSIDRETYLLPDGETPRVVELKTSRSDDGFADRDGWRDVEPEKRIPPGYYVQVQHYLEIAERPVADLAVLFGGSDFRIYEIPRDPDFGADLRYEEGDFWRTYVLPQIQPPVGPDDLAFLARKYPTSTDAERVATAEQTLLLDAYLGVVDQIKALETTKDDYRAKLEEAMGDVARLVAPGAIVSWKSHDRTTVGWKTYAESLEMTMEQLRGGTIGSLVDRVLSDGYGTTNLADVRSLYTAHSAQRPFRVDRKKEA